MGYIRRVIQKYFDQAVDNLKRDGHMDEVDSLSESTELCCTIKQQK